jgi:hypothetical protein
MQPGLDAGRLNQNSEILLAEAVALALSGKVASCLP